MKIDLSKIIINPMEWNSSPNDPVRMTYKLINKYKGTGYIEKILGMQLEDILICQFTDTQYDNIKKLYSYVNKLEASYAN